MIEQQAAESGSQDVDQLMISVIVPVYNGTSTIARCLQAITASDYSNFECIVVDDSSTDETVDIVREFGTRVLQLAGGPAGPAYARNRGVEVAKGDVVFFVDADVLIQPDTVSKMAGTFNANPKVDAAFGSYDDTPEEGEFSSQFKNLFHHFVHQQGREEAVTFWSGCGAVRRDVFLEANGFAESLYPRPSIEDIELGVRLKSVGSDIVVNKDIQVKHLKRWTIKGMVKADIFDRAVPWTQLIMRRKDLPSDLNLGISQRISAVLVCVLLAHLTLTAFFHNIVVMPLMAAVFMVVVGYWNWSDGAAPLGRFSRRAEILSYALVTLSVGAAIYFGTYRLAIPLGLLMFGILAARLIPISNPIWKRVLFVSLILGLVSGIVVLMFSFLIWLWVPTLVIVAGIIALNIRFYIFFASKRGIMFTFAVVPFHLMYFFYSIVTFAIVAGHQAWNGLIHRRA